MLGDEFERIADTPHGVKNNNSARSTRSSYESADSGYLSFTPHSHFQGYRTKSHSFVTSKHNRARFAPYQLRKRDRSYVAEHGSFVEESSVVPTNTSFDMSTTRLTFDESSKVDSSRSSFTMELRSHKKKQLRSSPVTKVAACNSFRDALKSPPLPAVPSSPFACEPFDSDAEMKLVISQSTPCIISSPMLPPPLHDVTFSPISYKTSPCLGSVNSKKLSNLTISDRNSKTSKPKRLDFSRRAIFESFHRHRATPDLTGKEHVDILKLLGEKSNHPQIVSRILNYLSPQDLCAVSMVSKSWQRICDNDYKAQERRLKHIILKQCTKENLLSINKSKYEEVQSSPRSRYPRRGFLTAVVTNLLPVPQIHISPTSPPVSPSKVIFHSFVKAGRSLAPRDQLAPCPQCKFACRVEHETNIGFCSRKGCPMQEFCVLCSSKIHVGEPCKMPLLATPTKKGSQHQPIVGTKQSKKNLKRISRLL